MRCCKKQATKDDNFDYSNPNPSTSFAPHRIFNIGNNSPVKLIYFIELLEKNLGKSIGANEMKKSTDVTVFPASQNPLPWTQHWLSSKGMQVAPQETEVESYIVGGIKQDVKKGQFAKFKL